MYADCCSRKTRCTGVEVEDQAGSVRAIAARLVVVCAGALLTPSLLLRSGIGPKALLEKLSVPCVADRPGVGQNSVTIQRLACSVMYKRLRWWIDQPIIQTILRYTANRSEKRNDLQIEKLVLLVGPAGRRNFC